MNTIEECIVTMIGSLLVRGNDEQLDPAILDLQELAPIKSEAQHSRKHGEEYPRSNNQ